MCDQCHDTGYRIDATVGSVICECGFTKEPYGRKSMIWTLEQLQKKDMPQINIADYWYPARPENYKYRTLRQRLKEAWAVFSGKAEAFIWPAGQ